MKLLTVLLNYKTADMTLKALRAVMRKRKPGEETTVKVRRGEKILEFKFKLGRG